MILPATTYMPYSLAVFAGSETEAAAEPKKDAQSKDEAMESIAAEGLSQIIKIAKEGGVYDKKDGVSYSIPIEDTGNEAVFTMKLDDKTLNEVLSIGVRKLSLDRIIFSVLAEGSMREVSEYAENADKKEIGRQISSLSNTIDSFYLSSFYYPPILITNSAEEEVPEETSDETPKENSEKAEEVEIAPSTEYQQFIKTRVLGLQ